MYYKDLIQFEPVVDIIQIREADDKRTALQHVENYVISEHMAQMLREVVFPQLQFEKPHNNKNVLIVGNYGTGKSHLMSVLSSIAEYPEAAQFLRNKDLIPFTEGLAGRFKVWRTEIGGVTRSLRDIILDELEIALETWGTPYHFPPANELTSHKDVLIEAVGTLQEKYPDKGLLLVVDELLDYLRSRDERELILDLNFLRELGEVAALTPFRFVAGLQETLFENPRFDFVSEQLRRVKDRFEQVLIAREDIAFVVAERLLKKDDAQKARVREHLARFQALYPGLAERMDEFVRMFPVHPAYIDVIEDVRVVEKRQILKTLSEAMGKLLEQEVPEDAPGVFSFDEYWVTLRENPSVRTISEVAEVVDKSRVLENRVRNAFRREHLKPMALRFIHALSVHRLTTDDIHVSLGLTAEELRDMLFPSIPLPEASADMLLDQVRVTLKEILRTVSGQYISYNEANGQYYLDVKKDIDFEAKIMERGEFLSESDLNRYFFDALRQVLDFSTTTYVSGARIWSFELPWRDHQVTRPGYFFFGAPDERSTAQPPRDFYVYFLPPFAPRKWQDEKRADEVIFQLRGMDHDFREIVQRYAGARAMASDSPNHRQVYLNKADETLRSRLLPWLQQNLLNHLYVTHQGVEKNIRAVLPGLPSTESPNPAELLHRAAAHLLETAFEDRYPEYPRFAKAQQPITEGTRSTAAAEAIRSIGRQRTRLGEAVLQGLGLLAEDGMLRPQNSLYAQHFLHLLHSKPEGQIVPRGEVLEKVAETLNGPIYKDLRFKLEVEWVVVVLAALVYHGDIVLALPGNKQLEADELERYAFGGVGELTQFVHYARPRSLPLGTWKEIFTHLGLSPALIQDESQRARAVQELQKKVQMELQMLATVEKRLQEVVLWNEPLLTERPTFVAEGGVIIGSDAPAAAVSSLDFKPAFRGYKKVLEALEKINTVGKLHNLRITPSDLADLPAWLATVRRVQHLLDSINELRALTDYLSTAEAYLPLEHPWRATAAKSRTRTLNTLRQLARGEVDATVVHALRQELNQLKQAYVVAYAEQHRRLALGPADDARRKKLYEDPRLQALRALQKVDLLRENKDQLQAWEQAISELRVCVEFHEELLRETPYCPHCRLNPVSVHTDQVAAKRLNDLDARLTILLRSWQQALRAALNSPQAQQSVQAMTPAERQPLEAFLQQDDEDPRIPPGFVESANRALRGIQALTLKVDDLLQALRVGGLPCTVDELKNRFHRFLQDALRGHDENHTRLTLDE